MNQVYKCIYKYNSKLIDLPSVNSRVHLSFLYQHVCVSRVLSVMGCLKYRQASLESLTNQNNQAIQVDNHFQVLQFQDRQIASNHITFSINIKTHLL